MKKKSELLMFKTLRVIGVALFILGIYPIKNLIVILVGFVIVYYSNKAINKKK